MDCDDDGKSVRFEWELMLGACNRCITEHAGIDAVDDSWIGEEVGVSYSGPDRSDVGQRFVENANRCGPWSERIGPGIANRCRNEV